MAIAPAPSRSEIWLVRFDPGVGAEIRKLRPALVVSRIGVGRLPLRIVVPITDWKPTFASFPWFVEIPANPDTGLVKLSAADTFQVKSVSIDRFRNRIGAVAAQQIDAVASAIALCVGAP